MLFDRFFRGRGFRPFQRPPESEVDDEFAFHLEQRVKDYIARGMDPDSARRAALERFGDMSGVRRDCAELLEADWRAERRRDWFEELRQDLRFGIRAAARAPFFSLLAVLTLALGIGANAAVFGVVKSVLLDPLPYADAGHLVRIYVKMLDGSMDRSSVSAGAVVDLTERQRSFSRLGYFFSQVYDVTYRNAADEPRLLKAGAVGPGFFETLGVRPELGRLPLDEDLQSPAGGSVMLSHEAWRRLFAGRTSVVGEAIRLNGVPQTVIGVLPPGFVGPNGLADIWVALDLAPMLRDPLRARGTHWLGVVGRVRPGATVEGAGRELTAIAADLAREHPEAHGGHTFVSVPLRDTMVGDTRTPLVVLMASASLVLLITCANLGGALLSRIISRRKEFAVRLALGAGRGRLVRQLLTESTLLSVAGGAAGLGLAVFGLSLVRGLAAPLLPPYAELALDPGAFGFAILLALTTGLMFGAAPALAVGRASPEKVLRDEARGASEGRRSRRLRGFLVAGQIALSVSLLAAAGLLIRSLWLMTTAPLGFEPNGVLTLTVQLSGQEYDSLATRMRFREAFTERLEAIAGVAEAASVTELPQPSLNRNGLTIEGQPRHADGSQPFIPYVAVSDDYFRVMRIPLIEGRTFGPVDRPDAPTAIVISQSMARRYWPDKSAIGARIRLGPHSNGSWAIVIGIVGDIRNDPARPVPEPMAYGSTRQDGWGAQTFVIRGPGNLVALVPSIRRELASLDRGIPLEGARMFSEVLSDGLAGRRLPAVLITGFGALALILASVGVYAMFAAMAAAREREFGVRVALGAGRFAIAGLVLRQGAGWMAAGLAGGALGIVAISRLLRDLLYGVSSFDPAVLGASVATLLLCALIALLVPVRRATRVDAMSVLH